MYFPAIMTAGRINTRVVTVAKDGTGTLMVYQEPFNSDVPLSRVIEDIVQKAPANREIQEIKVTQDGN